MRIIVSNVKIICEMETILEVKANIVLSLHIGPYIYVHC